MFKSSFTRALSPVVSLVVCALVAIACEAASNSGSVEDASTHGDAVGSGGDAGALDAVGALDVRSEDTAPDAAPDVPRDAGDGAVEDAWQGPWTCPDDMALVESETVVVCVDRYEASRPDASWFDAGTDESRAVSRADVLPWQLGDDRSPAAAACEAAGKRLCRGDEWQTACAGPDGLAYPYGDTYRDDFCNGFEAHGPSGFKLVPTGTMAHCESAYGLFDLSGNLWEVIRAEEELVPRGGAYDSTDGFYTHRCSFVRSGGSVETVGFRCCAEPTPLLP